MKVKPPLLHKRKWQDSVLDCNYILLTNLQTSCVYSISRRANPQIGYCSPPKVPSRPIHSIPPISEGLHIGISPCEVLSENAAISSRRKGNITNFAQKFSWTGILPKAGGKSRATEKRQREDHKLCRNQEWRPQVRLRVDFVCI